METNNFVLACNKIDSLVQKEFTKIEIPSFNCSVDELASSIAQLLHLNKNDFDVICFGRTLDFSKSLESYGINNGIILYLIKKKQEIAKELQNSDTASSRESPCQKQVLSNRNQEMCIALKSALMNPLFRKVLDYLAESEKRENLIAVNPELRSDPTLFGVLGDPELLNTYINRNNIKRVLKRYPYFLEVATHIAATFHEESSSGSSFHLDNYDRSSFLNYSIDAPSDDEMDDSDVSIGANNVQAASNRLAEYPANSFSSMLMRAYQNRSNQTSQQQQSAASSSVITQNMLRQALQGSAPSTDDSARSNTTNSSNQTNQSSSSGQPVTDAPQPRTTAQILIGWAPQLRQMHELGISDDIVAIQALEATNGDVQAALNIIFSDFN